MNELVEKIIKNKKILINGIKYKVFSLTEYQLLEDENEIYYKAILDDHKILAILDNEVSYFGGIVPNLNYTNNDDETITYKNNVYSLVGKGNQRVKKVMFGDYNNIEKDCLYTDYEYADNIISLGILTSENNKVADVAAEYIKNTDIIA